MNDGSSAAEHSVLWLYGLPGSGVAIPQAAGAPSLQELEQRPAEPAGLNARIWICYGSLSQGLAELVNRFQPPPPSGGAGGRTGAVAGGFQPGGRACQGAAA